MWGRPLVRVPLSRLCLSLRRESESESERERWKFFPKFLAFSFNPLSIVCSLICSLSPAALAAPTSAHSHRSTHYLVASTARTTAASPPARPPAPHPSISQGAARNGRWPPGARTAGTPRPPRRGRHALRSRRHCRPLLPLLRRLPGARWARQRRPPGPRRRRWRPRPCLGARGVGAGGGTPGWPRSAGGRAVRAAVLTLVLVLRVRPWCRRACWRRRAGGWVRRRRPVDGEEEGTARLGRERNAV